MKLIALPLAERYERFRDSVFLGLEESTPQLPGLETTMCELDLQSLWFSGAFGTEFTTTEGEPVKMVDFGHWNAGAGPDFTDCIVEVAGIRKKGDIELDPDARDWERHQHGANPDYEKVVLHLFLVAPKEQQFFTRTSSHRAVPQVLLQYSMLAVDASPTNRQAAARIGRCALPLKEMEATKVHELLESAAQFRLRAKSIRIHRTVQAQGREQTVFQALAQALGYRNNQTAFTLVTQRLPVRRLLKETALAREALLFGVAGFLEKIRAEETEPETRCYMRDLWSQWWRYRDDYQRWLQPSQTPVWKLAAVRPGNHPQRRLGALASMLESWSGVFSPLKEASRWSSSAWSETLLDLRHPFWSDHYTLLAPPTDKPIALIGETRLHEMLANIAYPLLIPERGRLWAEYLELPALLDNQKVRRAVRRLFGDAISARPFTRLLHQHQGLLQVYEDFCLEDDSACADCPFPERLRSWS